MTFKFEIRNDKYCLIFSDGLVLEQDNSRLGTIDYQIKTPSCITNFRRPDDRWTYYALFSNGTIEEYKTKKCACMLPREIPEMSPVDYEMYILLLNSWVKKGNLIYPESNRFSLEETINQFGKENHWLDDLVSHTFFCTRCSDELVITINTYRGGGGLKRTEKNNSGNV